MSDLKKIAAAVVLALGNSIVSAGTMGTACTPGSVTTPCDKSAWDFGGQALYLQAVGDDYFSTSTTVSTSSSSVTFSNDNRRFNQPWGWGFKLEGSYHFNTGNDLNLNWYHFSKKSTRNIFDRTLNTTFGARLEPKWDAVNLELGQRVDFGEQKNVRFHVGGQYARLERELNISNVASSLNFNAESKFTGFGPRFGSDFNYELGNGFAVYGGGAATVLVGDSRFNRNLAVPSLSTTVASVGSRTIIVPELEAKLGAKYTYAMAQGDLTLDAGYMWVDYIDALHTGFVSTQTNFGLDGVYFGAKWVGNVA